YFEHSKIVTRYQLLTSLQSGHKCDCLPAKSSISQYPLKAITSSLDVMDTLEINAVNVPMKEKLSHMCYDLWFTMLTYFIMGQPPYSFSVLHSSWVYVITVIYIYVIRTHMQILLERVSRLGTDTGLKPPMIKTTKICPVLVAIISPVISKTIFTQFMITAAILGTTLINIFIFADFSTQIASVVYFLAVLVQTSPCCYQATCLQHDSEQLALAIFHCKWFNKDIRFRKMMIYFTMRSQTPITLTAMKLFPITLRTSLGATHEATAYLYKNFRFSGLKPCVKWQQIYKYLYNLLSVSVNLLVLGYFPLSFPLSYYYESHKMSAEKFLTSLQVFINVLGLTPKVIVLRLLLKRLYQSKDIMNILDAHCLLSSLVQTSPCCYQATCLQHDSEQFSVAHFPLKIHPYIVPATTSGHKMFGVTNQIHKHE
ncbi:Odorant receptor 7a, partial [Lucilia cuprina]